MDQDPRTIDERDAWCCGC